MICPYCSKSISNSDGLVTHLAISHDISRIDARKEVIEILSNSEGVKNEFPDCTNSPEVPLKSKREKMIDLFRDQYRTFGCLPYYKINNIVGFTVDDYIDEFGSVYGAAVFAGVTDIKPEMYDHEADGSKKYSEWELISELWRLYEQTGKVSVRLMDYAGKYSSQTYRYRFGSWSNALEKAQLEVSEPSIPASRGSNLKFYGRKEWKKLRSKALERDNYECQSCGMTADNHQEKYDVGLNVHHVIDIAEFENPRDANYIDNLETLCSKCHGRQHPFSKQ